MDLKRYMCIYEVTIGKDEHERTKQNKIVVIFFTKLLPILHTAVWFYCVLSGIY